jgi:hypothetical protein
MGVLGVIVTPRMGEREREGVITTPRMEEERGRMRILGCWTTFSPLLETVC